MKAKIYSVFRKPRYWMSDSILAWSRTRILIDGIFYWTNDYKDIGDDHVNIKGNPSCFKGGMKEAKKYDKEFDFIMEFITEIDI